MAQPARISLIVPVLNEEEAIARYEKEPAWHLTTILNSAILNDHPEEVRIALAAGADIIETNTFNGTSISQSDFNLQHLVFEINKTAGELAR